MGAGGAKNNNISQSSMIIDKKDISKNDYIRQKKIKDYPDSCSKNDMKKIYRQMEKCICKILLDKNNFATGFFCNITFTYNNKNLPVLITNNHIFEKYIVFRELNLILLLDDQSQKYELLINDSRIFLKANYMMLL